MKSGNEFWGGVCLLLGMAILVAAYDVWEVASGAVDFNKHVPFLFPIFLVVFASLMLYTQHRVKSRVGKIDDRDHPPF